MEKQWYCPACGECCGIEIAASVVCENCDILYSVERLPSSPDKEVLVPVSAYQRKQYECWRRGLATAGT